MTNYYKFFLSLTIQNFCVLKYIYRACYWLRFFFYLDNLIFHAIFCLLWAMQERKEFDLFFTKPWALPHVFSFSFCLLMMWKRMMLSLINLLTNRVWPSTRDTMTRMLRLVWNTQCAIGKFKERRNQTTVIFYCLEKKEISLFQWI